jgi:hypothetical protein
MPISDLEVNLTTSEAQALGEIVRWSAECPTWQRDALRRLCGADKLYPDDIDALLTLCKSASNGEPLTADHVRDPAAGLAAVTLKQVEPVLPRRPLPDAAEPDLSWRNRSPRHSLLRPTKGHHRSEAFEDCARQTRGD